MAENDWLGDVPEGGWQATHSWKMPEWVEPIVCYCRRERNTS